ncbi:MAG: serine protease, partial [Pseudomonadota bacterium]
VVDGCRQMIVDGGDEVEVLAVDRVNDLALLAHQVTRTDAQIARFAPSGPRLNSDVTVVGYPLYGLLGGLNVTRGVVSSLKGLRGDETFIQISAEVQPGNSGGPALNARGYVVGVVQSKLDAVRLSERIGDIPQNVNFAIRADIAQTFLKENGVDPLIGSERDRLEPADLAEAAQEFTVLLECIK